MSASDVLIAEERLQALLGFVPGTALPVVAPEPTVRKAIPLAELPLEVRQRIEELAGERDGIHAQKSKLANALVAIPDEVNAKTMVREILNLRQAWRDKQDAIYAIMQTGVAEVAQAVAALPVDIVAVRVEIGRLISNLNKARKRRGVAKEIATQRRQDISIAQMEGELARWRTHLSTL